MVKVGRPQNRYRWTALFRDGHVIEQSDDHDYSLVKLLEYTRGSGDNPKRHYLLWFKINDENGETPFTVDFDMDGDAYIFVTDGAMLMTNYKLRSANLLYNRELDDNGLPWITVGFGGINTMGMLDARAIRISPRGTYRIIKDIVHDYDKLKI